MLAMKTLSVFISLLDSFVYCLLNFSLNEKFAKHPKITQGFKKLLKMYFFCFLFFDILNGGQGEPIKPENVKTCWM